jgi:hypothetical protein
VNTIEDGARAAMREIAETVADVPALRLDPATLQFPQSAEARRADERALRKLPAAAKRAASADPRAAGARRFPTWLAPLTAAAVVVAIAVSLVVLKTHPNEAAVSPSAPISVPSGSVPRYFAELNPTGDLQNSPSDVLIADTYTGKIMATVAPPAGLTFTSVSAASDDRTFVLFTTPSGTHSTGRWYELRIAPGTAHPATLTRLPISPLPSVVAMAVSGSGRELAVVQSGPLRTQPDVLSIYSLATGRVLHSWSTPYGSRVLPYFSTNATGPLADWPTLTWVDGDRGITYPGQPSPSASATSFTWKMRQLDVAAKGGNLLADSRVVWTDQSANSGRDQYGCDLNNPLGVSTDGRSFVCASGTGRANADRLMKWLTFPSGASPHGRLLYQTESNMGSGSSGYDSGLSDNDVVLWTNQSGSTVIVLWYRFSNSAGITGTHFGVISGGRYFPLPATLITNATAWSQTSIAW